MKKLLVPAMAAGAALLFMGGSKKSKASSTPKNFIEPMRVEEIKALHDQEALKIGRDPGPTPVVILAFRGTPEETASVRSAMKRAASRDTSKYYLFFDAGSSNNLVGMIDPTAPEGSEIIISEAGATKAFYYRIPSGEAELPVIGMALEHIRIDDYSSFSEMPLPAI